MSAIVDGGMMDAATIAALPPQYTHDIAVDPRGFVYIGGVCIGRLLTERDRVYFEVKDRSAQHSAQRGAQFIRVDIAELIASLTR